MRIGEEAHLDQRDGNGGVAPGHKLTAIDGQRRDPLDTLGPDAHLLMVLKLASEREERGMIALVGGIDQPAIKLNAGTRSRRRETGYIRRQHMFQLRARWVVQVQGLQRLLVGLQLLPEGAIIERKLPSLELEGRLQFAFMKHTIQSPRAAPSYRHLATG